MKSIPWRANKKYLPDFIFGSVDGLVTTLAVVSGVIGASLSSYIILILGIANLLADGFSMGASNYLSTKSENDMLQDQANHKNAFFAGFTTLIAFIVIGCIPLIPFIFDFGQRNYTLSLILTGIAFAIVGYIKGQITQTSRIGSAVVTLLIGALASIIAYLAGYFISVIVG